MKLQQLQYLSAVIRSDLNVSAAARRLRASQPALSKQIRLLEDEIGAPIFVRQARQFTELTAVGQQILQHVQSIPRESRYIQDLAAELRHDDRGELSTGTTHTLARYVLPGIISRFRRAYPRIRLHLHEGTVEQIAGDLSGVVGRTRRQSVALSGDDGNNKSTGRQRLKKSPQLGGLKP